MMTSQSALETPFPRGSEWRRWDLHVHTPASELGTSFPGVEWDDYLNALHASSKQAGVSVIGITDYMSIDGYKRVLSASRDNSNPRYEHIALFVPNIEMRVSPPTKDNKAINLHLLVDPSDPEHVKKIETALQKLNVTYNKEQYGCSTQDLTRFGHAQKDGLSDDQAYQFGIQQFKPSCDAIRAWLNTSGWLRANCLVGIANGKDGISGLPLDGWGALRDELLRSSDFVFSGNANDRSHYLGEKTGIPVREIIRQYGSLKPCLHGSDAHELKKLFLPDQDRFCWIKSDPTFEGLRQLLWEPKERVHIGPTRPMPSDASKIIASIRFTHGKSWFTQEEIPLNSGLVAIIGEKGSGKTAIADLIALAAGVNLAGDSQTSFVTKAKSLLAGIDVRLDWTKGKPTTAQLPDKPHPSQRPLVRYLSQDFVERLCSTDHEGAELEQAIEEVVFSYLAEDKQEGYSSFNELRAGRESFSQSRQDQLRGDLATLHREIDRLQTTLDQVPGKIAMKSQLVAQIAELKQQLPAIESVVDQQVLLKIEEERTEIAKLEEAIATKSRARRSLDFAADSLTDIRERTNKQVQELIDATLLDYALPPDLQKRLFPSWDEGISKTLTQKALAIGKDLELMRGGPPTIDSSPPTLASRQLALKQLQTAVSTDAQNRKRLIDLQKLITTQEATVQRLTKEISDTAEKINKTLKDRQLTRDKTYLSTFDVLKENRLGLEELYEPMKSKLSTVGSAAAFELSVGVRVDVHAWLERSFRFFDGRKPAASSQRQVIEEYVLTTLLPAWRSADPLQIGPAFTGFYDVVNPLKFMEDCASPSIKLVELFDWMYASDHIRITYKLLYGGVELEYLSPGSRGIALLVLYLQMDDDDHRPLLIDQPEGNLDNASVYQQLVPFLCEAKKNRQIILVTHNPNLVVTTDAEQVIVATAERPATQTYPLITYRSGSLENSSVNEPTGIRQAVCTLLEGGEQAFKRREERYSLP